MDRVAEEMGARRWIVAARRDDAWAVVSSEPSHLDDLYRQVAVEIDDRPSVFYRAAPELGGPGLRLEAGGVGGLALIVFASGAEAVVGFLENADGSAVEALAGSLPEPALDLIGRVLPASADAAAHARELRSLSAWLPTLRELARDEADAPTALQRLAEGLGVASLVSLRRRGDIAQAAVVWRAGRGSGWNHHDGPVPVPSGEQPLSEPEIQAVVGTLGHPVHSWVTGTSNEARPLMLAAPSGSVSSHLLSVAASLLSAATRRGRDLAAARTNALLQERARIASVIHEGITQVLTNVVLQMEILDRLMEDPEKGREMLGKMRGAVLEALDSLRGAILELTPAAPEWSDLAGGLERFAGDFAAQWGLEIRYRVEGKQRDVDPEVIALVFGFVQEGLSNVRKHAGVKEADVVLEFLEELVRVEVIDQGAGFDPGRAEEEGLRHHQGLSIMRSRARLAGGAFDVNANEEGGTTVSLELPA